MSENREHWHLRKELNVTHLLTTIIIIVSAIWWASGVETRQAITETKVKSLEHNIGKLENYLIRIEDKVDRIRK